MSQIRYIKVAYRMLTSSAASHKLLFETEPSTPVAFVTGMGLMIDGFEKRLMELEPGAQFDFTLQPEEAFGLRDEKLVQTLPRKDFEVRGKFHAEEVFEGGEIEIQDDEGNIFKATVVRVTDTEVTIDMNSPYAGRALQFTGTMYENREATLQEMADTARILSDDGQEDDENEGGHA